MKKFFLGAISLLIASACTNDEYVMENISNSSTETCMTRSMNEVLQIASNATQLLQNANTRSVTRTVDPTATQYVIAPSTRSSGGNDTLLYIVNYADGQGFAVVAANKQAEGLLAVVEKGSYGMDGEYYTENPGFTAFMEQAQEYAKTLSLKTGNNSGGELVLTEHKLVRDTTYLNKIEPMVNVRWGQTGIEGKYCPNKVAGCSNVAMAQIMSYFQYPLSININYPDASVTSQYLNWSAIKEHEVVDIYQECNATYDTHEAISQLLRQLGYMNNSSYITNPNKTMTYDNNVRISFSQLGYNVSSSLISYNNQDIETLLANGSLLYMRGNHKDKETGEEMGHAWVADGIHKVSVHSTEWTRPMGQLGWTLTIDYGTQTTEYLHYNWGWDGNCNGFFVAGIFNPNSGSNYDNNKNWFYRNTSDYNFTTSIQYFTVSR